MATRRKGKRLKRPTQPAGPERQYRRLLLELVQRMRAASIKHIAKLRAVDRADDEAAKARAEKRNVVDIERVINGLRTELDTIVKKARPGLIAQRIGKTTRAFAVKANDDVIRGVVAISSSKVAARFDLDGFVKENVDLITSIPKKLVSTMEPIALDAWKKGKHVDEVQALIMERFDVTESRARLIARDQVAKLNSQVTEARQTEIGIEEYEWSTSRDERVRDSHREKDGQRFRWDNPPADTGHPGEDFQCRCIAVPILPPDLQ